MKRGTAVAAVLFLALTVLSFLFIPGCGDSDTNKRDTKTEMRDYPSDNITDIESLGSVEVYPGVFIEGLGLQKVIVSVSEPGDPELLSTEATEAFLRVSGNLNSLLPKEKRVTVDMRVGLQTESGEQFLWLQWPRHGYGTQHREPIPYKPVVDFWIDDVQTLVWPDGVEVPHQLYDSSRPPRKEQSDETPEWLPGVPLNQEKRSYRLEEDNKTEVVEFELVSSNGAPMQFAPGFLLNCYDCAMFRAQWSRDDHSISPTSRRYIKDGWIITLEILGPDETGSSRYRVSHFPEGNI